MRRSVRVALAAYPPSWRERYGEELADLAVDRSGVTADLLVGAARAWLHAAGRHDQRARTLSAICTTHVAWCVIFVGVLGYLKQVNDPPLPGLTSGASQPLWGAAKAAFFAGWLVLLVGGTALLSRISWSAVRNRDWRALRPMVPAAALLVVVLATIPVVSHYGHQQATATSVTVILLWLALGFALVVAGAVGPVVTLRRSRSSSTSLRWPLRLAVTLSVIACGLAGVTAAQAAVLSDDAPTATLLPMWGAVAIIVAAATSSATSVRRALT